MIGVYMIKNTINGKIYIGCSINVERRLNAHRYYLIRGNHPNLHLQQSWNKYGKEAFIFELIEECINSVLYKREHFFATFYDCLNNKKGYNKLPTSENKRPSFFTEEIRKKISLSKIGIPCKYKGVKRPAEVIEKMKLNRKSTTGINNPMYGRKNPTTSERNKLRTKKTMPSDYVWPSSVAVFQYTKNMELIKRFDSVREAAKSVNRTQGAISMCITGRNTTCAGYIWTRVSS
jgi:group I intron endonuclease